VLAKSEALRPWVQRHNLLAGRSGFALPDLTIYYDGGLVTVRSVPDPFFSDSAYPVRFVGDVEVRLHPDDFDTGLRNLVEAVVERVRELAGENLEAREFLDNWEAVKESVRSEPVICSTAAAMGLDPYDPAEMTDEVIGLLEGLLASLSSSFRQDLAEATTKDSLYADLLWTQKAAKLAAVDLKRQIGSDEDASLATLPAYEAGYERAREFRKAFGPPQENDLEGYLRDHVGWGVIADAPPPVDSVAKRINALIGVGDGGKRQLVPAAGDHAEENLRFLAGRALFFSSPINESQAPRLLTRATSWPQRASRAFAAELLAPASELSRLVDRDVTYRQVDDLAHRFGVSPMVIHHQLENHEIARVVDM
jgi:hypothetical protein